MNNWATEKLKGCIRLARNCNHDYLLTRDRRFLRVRNEAMQDARYWKSHGASKPCTTPNPN